MVAAFPEECIVRVSHKAIRYCGYLMSKVS